MEVKKPSPAEVAELLEQHANRWPQKAPPIVMHENGKEVLLPFVFGNPTATCEVSDPRLVSPAWRDSCAATFRLKDDDEGALLRDCTLYPPPRILGEWLDRWPALVESVVPELKAKLGWKRNVLVDPPIDYTVSERLAELLAANPRAVLRLVKLDSIAIVLGPPKAAIWRMFITSMRKGSEDAWSLCRQFALSVTLGVDGVASAEMLYDRWPGVTLVVCLYAAGVAGMAADVRKGEW